MTGDDQRLEPKTAADTDDGHCLHSIAISLKRIADVAEQFSDHPDRRNAYGEHGIAALMGELSRFKNEVINDIHSMMMRR